ncbi:MAG: serine protease Do [Blastocatellia bacterium]|jgi:membrane-associated protease RseP (regulator of RpoE activity)|nr:serine protease Do [Blastocatellia bacterium]
MEKIPSEDFAHMKMKNTLLLLASLMLCFAGSTVLQAQTAATPPAAPAPPAIATTPAPPVAQSDALMPAMALLLQGENFLGILPGDVTRDNMGRYGLQEPRGVAVTKVIESSPAARAGLKEGDVILRFDNEPVNSVNKLERLINEAAPEQNIRLHISRQGSEQELNVTLSKRKDFPAMGALPQGEMLRAMPQVDALRGLMPTSPNGENFAFALGTTRRIGVGATQLTEQLADYFGVKGGRGVLVTSVNENSPAARAGLKAGDVIKEVDGQQTGTIGELSRALNRQNDGEVTLNIVRDKHQRTVKVTPERGQLVPFSGPEELVMPQIGKLAFPRMEFPKIQNFKLAPLTLPNLKIITPKLAPMPRIISLPQRPLL